MNNHKNEKMLKTHKNEKESLKKNEIEVLIKNIRK